MIIEGPCRKYYKLEGLRVRCSVTYICNHMGTVKNTAAGQRKFKNGVPPGNYQGVHEKRRVTGPKKIQSRQK